MPEPGESVGILDRLDVLPPWAFTSMLYLARWVINSAGGFLLPKLACVQGKSVTHLPGIELIGGVLLDPLIETLIECSLPYWMMKKLGGIPAGKRPWGFVAVSAAIMTLLHIGAWPLAILPTLITGIFLGYVYARFASERWGKALLHTWAFHAGINIVGWTLGIF